MEIVFYNNQMIRLILFIKKERLFCVDTEFVVFFTWPISEQIYLAHFFTFKEEAQSKNNVKNTKKLW